MKSSNIHVEWGCGFDALCEWISHRSQKSSYLSKPSQFKISLSDCNPPEQAGWIGAFSSGSTGHPKLFWKNIKQLNLDCSRHPKNEACTWATCFDAVSFAGIQVAVQAVISGGNVLSLNNDWSNNLRLIAQAKPEILVATPSFLEHLIHSLQASGIKDWRPQQITLGGEPIRPLQGHFFCEHFPKSRFTLIYASAEIGVIAKTHRTDGWFPISSLKKRFNQWCIRDNELALRTHGIWHNTGDVCEVKKDHFRINGRVDRVINVGGHKVCLNTIERLAETLPEVMRAMAYAKQNPIMGNVVGLVVEPYKTTKNEKTLVMIQNSLQLRLPKPAWPRIIQWGSIPEWNNGKRVLYP